MDKFTRWTAIARATLLQVHPRIKLGQARECLAAWVGHRTYASLRVRDLALLDGSARYVIVDPQAAMDRAGALGFPITREQWRTVEMALMPSGISGGTWLVDFESMHSAARITFEDESHTVMEAIKRSIGMGDGHWAKSSDCHSSSDLLPAELRFAVSGEVRAFNSEASLAVPVVAEVEFRRIGARVYAQGSLVSVAQAGPPQEYEPEFEGDFYYMSED